MIDFRWRNRSTANPLERSHYKTRAWARMDSYAE